MGTFHLAGYKRPLRALSHLVFFSSEMLFPHS